MYTFIISLFLFFFTGSKAPIPQSNRHILASESMPLQDRYPVKSVNKVFKDNILLTFAYMRGNVKNNAIDWNQIEKPFHYEITLHKDQVFSFHESVLPKYSKQIAMTTHAHFNSQDGFKSDGYLYGDGVCHLASLMNFAAQSAGLSVLAPTSHDFANIPDVPKKYGVAIYFDPSNPAASAQENLYITNTTQKDVIFTFDYQDNTVKASVITLG